jgi:acetolactate synthase I/II/III large subunit
MKKTVAVETTAQGYLELLHDRGVDCFFGNGGTDFASIVDAFARLAADGKATPRPITVPHEHVAGSMAHGYYLATGRPQVVMVHVTVGTANVLGSVINAARLRVPVIFTAGRTPITEAGSAAARDVYIHWAQEAFDQAAPVREYVKWDYELRNFAQLETVVDRALALASSEPRGPVYLSLPREVLVEPQRELSFESPSRVQPAAAAQPEQAALRQAAQWLAEAERPLVIAGQIGVWPAAVDQLDRLARRFALPVAVHQPAYLNLPADHPMHQGYLSDPLLGEADVILVLESDAPWFPLHVAPREGARVIQLGIDPLFSRYPIRGFPADLAISGDVAPALAVLQDELARLRSDEARLKERFDYWSDQHDRQRAAWHAASEAAARDCPISPEWLSHCVGQVVDETTTVVNEYSLLPHQLDLSRPGSYLGPQRSSALGWGLGAALGVKLAQPEQTVICGVGDGSYIFGAPTAAHWVARAYDLPVLFVIVNNRAWGAVKQAALSVHPDGWAIGQDNFPFTSLDPSPEYARIVEAHGGYGERVDDPSEIRPALQRGLRAVRDEKRQALLDVRCRQP